MLSQVFAVVIGVSFMVGPSTATIAGETECHRQYQDNYQPLYGSCTAFSVLTACVEAEMPQDNIGVRGDMQERLDSKQPAVSSKHVNVDVVWKLRIRLQTSPKYFVQLANYSFFYVGRCCFRLIGDLCRYVCMCVWW